MRSVIVACMLLVACGPAVAQASIGITVGAFPALVAVPGYPVYYAPQLDSNFFFYDGLYWVYAEDRWYASSWYDGPWDAVAPEGVPNFVLRVPVRYYRHPPRYFSHWAADAPPRWGEHWGRTWERRRGDWDRWDRASAPAPAPLPTYQRAYSGQRYPREDQQLALRKQNYHYQPHEASVRQYLRQPPQKVPPVREAQAEHEQVSTPPDSRRGRLAVPGESAIPLRRAKSHPPQDGPATDATHSPGAHQGAQSSQPGNQSVESDRGTLNRSLPKAPVLLLGLALLSGVGAVPAQASTGGREQERDH